MKIALALNSYKYLKAYGIVARVIRLIPKKNDNPEVQIYYEFLDFYKATASYNVRFEKEGKYEHLLKAINVSPDNPLDKEEQKEFRQTYEIFEVVFKKFYIDGM